MDSKVIHGTKKIEITLTESERETIISNGMLLVADPTDERKAIIFYHRDTDSKLLINTLEDKGGISAVCRYGHMRANTPYREDGFRWTTAHEDDNTHIIVRYA